MFDTLVNKNVFGWNIMMGGYAKHNHTEEAKELFNQMFQNGVQPNGITFSTILKACANPSALQWGREVHACVRHAGLESDVLVGSALVHMYAKCGSIDDARVVFGRMEEHDVISWKIMIGGLAKHGFGQEAYELFLRMQQEGIKPTAFTYASILNPCASAGALEWVKEVHGHALKAGLESDLRVGSALVHMYANCGSLDDGRVAFERMEDRNVITWNVMIGGLAEHGFGREAYELFLEMQQEGIKPDAITYASILNPCASAGALEWVKEVHGHALKAGLESDLRVGNALVHMHAECGSLGDARTVFFFLLPAIVPSHTTSEWSSQVFIVSVGFGRDRLRTLALQMQTELTRCDCTWTMGGVDTPLGSTSDGAYFLLVRGLWALMGTS